MEGGREGRKEGDSGGNCEEIKAWEESKARKIRYKGRIRKGENKNEGKWKEKEERKVIMKETEKK